jgi:hypothetical protein
VLTPAATTTPAYCTLYVEPQTDRLEWAQYCLTRVPEMAAKSGFWDVNIGTFTPFLAALLALFGVGITLWQRHRTDRSDELWKRMSWAIDHAASSDPGRQEAGLNALNLFLRANEVLVAPDGKRTPRTTLWGAQGSSFTLSPSDIELCELVATAALEDTMSRQAKEEDRNG